MALDSNGIWLYQENDTEATASDLLNLLADSTSDRVADLQAQVDAKQANLGDTGWIDATLTNDFVLYAPGDTVRYRRIGNQVQVRGIVKPANSTAASTISGSSGVATIFNLPAGFIPVDGDYAICQGSQTDRWMLHILPTGEVNARRYSGTAATGTWMPFSHTFFVG